MIAAPGCDVKSTFPGGGYAVMSGTSMASPAVAGAAALLLEQRTTAHATDLERALLGGSQPGPALADSLPTGAVLSVSGAIAALAALLRPGRHVLLDAEQRRRPGRRAVSAANTSATARIAPSTHTWSAVAYDRSGNETTTSR